MYITDYGKIILLGCMDSILTHVYSSSGYSAYYEIFALVQLKFIFLILNNSILTDLNSEVALICISRCDGFRREINEDGVFGRFQLFCYFHRKMHHIMSKNSQFPEMLHYSAMVLQVKCENEAGSDTMVRYKPLTPALAPEEFMENIVPDKYYDIADEYALESEEPVEEQEYDGLAHYFQLLITFLTNNEEISEEAQKKMAAEAGIDKQRIDDIAEFLNRWGND